MPPKLIYQANVSKHRAEAREGSRRYRATHPGEGARWQAMYRQCGIRWRASERAVWVEPIVPLVVYELADGICALCGEDVPPDRYEVDHTLSLLGGGEHSYENVQLAHVSCNRSKGTREKNAQMAAAYGGWSGVGWSGSEPRRIASSETRSHGGMDARAKSRGCGGRGTFRLRGRGALTCDARS